ncbi:MAG: Tfp pilus assembly protein FimT/FimU [Planctomycetota bacterium]
MKTVTGTARPRSRAWRGQMGFTLMEMMVTIAIVMLALVSLLPALGKSFLNRKLNGAGSILVKLLGEARNKAITQKQSFSVVFYKRGAQLFQEAKGTKPAMFVGNMLTYAPGDTSETVTYELRFAGANGAYSALRDATPADFAPPLEDSGEVFIRFNSDGTVDFAKNQDINSALYRDGVDADIIITQGGLNDRRGLIDVKNTGRVNSKVHDLEPDET